MLLCNILQGINESCACPDGSPATHVWLLGQQLPVLRTLWMQSVMDHVQDHIGKVAQAERKAGR